MSRLGFFTCTYDSVNQLNAMGITIKICQPVYKNTATYNFHNIFLSIINMIFDIIRRESLRNDINAE